LGGKTVHQIAEEIGFPARNVRAVLYGQSKGNRGQAHHIAVALGMKDKPE
jgi:gp16 family phage-associated protein